MTSLRSGQKPITTAGTAEQGPSTPTARRFLLAAHPSNTGVVWVGDNGSSDVDNSTGFPLEAGGDTIVVEVPRSLGDLWFDVDVSGEKVCWLVLL